VLQRLSVGVLGGALDQTLTHCVDVLQLWLNAVHLLSLHSLREEERQREGMSLIGCEWLLVSLMKE